MSYMGTIVQRGDSFRAVIRKKGHPTLTKTFEKRALAKAWVTETEAAIAKQELASYGVSVGKLFERYLLEIAPIKKLSAHSEKAYRHLGNTTKTLYVNDLSAATLLAWKAKHHPNVSAASLRRYLTRITTVLTVAEALWECTVPWREFRKSKFHLKTIQAIGPGRPRDRRVSNAEISLVKEKIQSALPVADIIDFAILTCMRSGEITALKWSDVDKVKRTVVIRDRKHPTLQEGNNSEIPLLGDSLAIIERQPKGDDPRIFPFNSSSVEAAFRRARKLAGIEDLHFHDLRHEGTSRLFEQGYQIQEVALITGHSSWNSLKIYTNLKPESLHRD